MYQPGLKKKASLTFGTMKQKDFGTYSNSMFSDSWLPWIAGLPCSYLVNGGKGMFEMDWRPIENSRCCWHGF